MRICKEEMKKVFGGFTVVNDMICGMPVDRKINISNENNRRYEQSAAVALGGFNKNPYFLLKGSR
jgi:hypothetical protein